MNAPGDDSPQSGSYGSKEITEYLLSGLARITTPKPGVAALPFSCADGVVTAGAHRVAVAAILERTDPVHGKIAAGVRFEVTVDGSRVVPLTHWVLAVDESVQKACEQAVGDWYRAFGLCMFSGLAEAEPATTVSGWEVYAGFMGFRGSPPQGWLDGSAQMHDTILAALSMYLPSRDGEFHSLALMVVSNPDGRPNAKCELDAKDAPQAVAVLIALPWPISGSSYMFKQAYVLR
jgi:hypothetical protein